MIVMTEIVFLFIDKAERSITQSQFGGSSTASVAQDGKTLLVFDFLLAEALSGYGQRLNHRSFMEMIGFLAPAVEITNPSRYNETITDVELDNEI